MISKGIEGVENFILELLGDMYLYVCMYVWVYVHIHMHATTCGDQRIICESGFSLFFSTSMWVSVRLRLSGLEVSAFIYWAISSAFHLYNPKISVSALKIDRRAVWCCGHSE